MAPQIELLLRLLRELDLVPLRDSVRGLYFVPIESGSDKLLLNIEPQETVINFSCVALPIERIPVGAEGTLNGFLLRVETRLCRYSTDRMGNVVLQISLPFSLLTKDLVLAIVDEIRSEAISFPDKIAGTIPFEGSIILFPARLQPPHKGHFDGIIRLLEGDESVLADPRNEESVRLLKNLRTLVVSIGQVSRQKGNPLHLGERRDLVTWEINRNPGLRKHADRLVLEPSPIGDPNVWLPALLRNLSPKPDAIASANPQTIVAARDLNLRAMEMSRDPKTSLSGTKVRELIAGDKLEVVRDYLSEPVFERCQTQGYFRTIRDIETGY